MELPVSQLGGRVLVLNQGYEPVSVCSVKKALILTLLTKAEVIEERKGRIVHSVRHSHQFPSVIRLSAYIRIPHKRVELSRKNILRRDGHRCQYCGSTTALLTLDHIFPRSRGGPETWENLVCACIRCNNRKGSRTPEEANMKLLSAPRRPHHVVFLKHFMGTVDDNWKPYLFMD